MKTGERLKKMQAIIEQQQKEIAVLKEKVISEQDLFDRAHKRGNDLHDEIAELETKLAYAEDAAMKGNLARLNAAEMEMEIETLRKQIKELGAILTLLRDECKANPVMNHMRYDDLGWRVNQAIDAAIQETKTLTRKQHNKNDTPPHENT